jgi:hypothetical protein
MLEICAAKKIEHFFAAGIAGPQDQGWRLRIPRCDKTQNVASQN